LGVKEELVEAKAQARAVIEATERALKKHIGLIKKRQRIATIVAMIERLRGEIRGDDLKTIRGHIRKLNELTQGFVDRVALGKKKNTVRVRKIRSSL
jgi:hypothetical protein